MVYVIEFEVHSGCRGQGGQYPYGAAATVRRLRDGRHKPWTRDLESNNYSPKVTYQRTEITAIIIALEEAIEEIRGLASDPEVEVTISSDSRYAINCMNEWIYKWSGNGWRNCSGNPVVNQDLIREASDLDDELRDLADMVDYIWIPREENELADSYCKDRLDEMDT